MKIWSLESQCINDECDSDRRWECGIPEKGREEPLWEQSEWDEEPLHSLVGQVVMAGARKSPGENFSGKLLKSTHYPSGWLGCALWFLCFFHPCHGTKCDQGWEVWRPTLRRTAKTSCQKRYVRRGRERTSKQLIWLLEFAMKVLSISGIYSHSFAQFALNIRANADSFLSNVISPQHYGEIVALFHH